MSLSEIANVASLPVGLVCLALSIRAFYLYALSRSDVVFIIAFAMGSIAIAILFGVTGQVHLGGNNLNTNWARYTGSSSGALFIFLSSLVKSHEQMQQLRRWQLIAAMVFLAVILLTPLLPPLNPLVSASYNSVRTVIYGAAFIRYAALYATKGTRFSLIMCVGFLFLVIGFILFTPQLLYPPGDSAIATVTITGAFVRIFGYSIVALAYSFG